MTFNLKNIKSLNQYLLKGFVNFTGGVGVSKPKGCKLLELNDIYRLIKNEIMPIYQKPFKRYFGKD